MGRWPWRMEVKALAYHVVWTAPAQARQVGRAGWRLVCELCRFTTLFWAGWPVLLVLIFLWQGVWMGVAAAFVVLMGAAAVWQSGAHRRTWRDREHRRLVREAARMPEEQRRFTGKP